MAAGVEAKINGRGIEEIRENKTVLQFKSFWLEKCVAVLVFLYEKANFTNTITNSSNVEMLSLLLCIIWLRLSSFDSW